MRLVMGLAWRLGLLPCACRWTRRGLILNGRHLTRVRNLFVCLRNRLLMIRYPFRLNSTCSGRRARYSLIGLGEVLLLRWGTLRVHERRVLLGNEDLSVVEIVRSVMAQSEPGGIVFLLLQYVVLSVELGEPWVLLDFTKR